MSEALDWNATTIAEFRANEGRVGGVFEDAPSAIASTQNKRGATQASPSANAKLLACEPFLFSNSAGRSPPGREHPAQPSTAAGYGRAAVSTTSLDPAAQGS
jgi:hypothetical protein